MSFYLIFRGTFTNSGGHTKSFKFLPVKLNSYPEISYIRLPPVTKKTFWKFLALFLVMFELEVDGSARHLTAKVCLEFLLSFQTSFRLLIFYFCSFPA